MAIKIGTACTECGIAFQDGMTIIPVYKIAEVKSHVVIIDDQIIDAYHEECFAKKMVEIGFSEPVEEESEK